MNVLKFILLNICFFNTVLYSEHDWINYFSYNSLKSIIAYKHFCIFINVFHVCYKIKITVLIFIQLIKVTYQLFLETFAWFMQDLMEFSLFISLLSYYLQVLALHWLFLNFLNCYYFYQCHQASLLQLILFRIIERIDFMKALSFIEHVGRIEH